MMHRRKKSKNNSHDNDDDSNRRRRNASSSSSSFLIPLMAFSSPRQTSNNNSNNNHSSRRQTSNNNNRNNSNNNNDNVMLSRPAQVLRQMLLQQQRQRQMEREQQQLRRQTQRSSSQQQHHHKARRRQRQEQDDDDDEEEDGEEDECDDDDDDDISEAIALASILSGMTGDDDDDDNQEDEEEEEAEEEEDNDDEEEELVIEAELDGNADPRKQREIVNQISDVARNLIRACPNFSALRVTVPSLPPPSTTTTSSQKLQKLPPPLLPPPRTTSSSLLFTLVIDLDETIVQSRDLDPALFDSAERQDLQRTANWYFTQRDKHIVYRPHLDTLVQTLTEKLLPRENLEVVIWTASERDYATTVLNHYLLRRNDSNKELENQQFWDHLITRENCAQHHWANATTTLPKNLNWLGRNIDHCMLLENSPGSSHASPDNAILVPDFHNNSKNSCNDESLRIAAMLIEYVFNQVMHHNNTVQKALQQRWCLNYLELSSFRVPGVRGNINCKTLSYCPPGVAQRTFGEEAHH